MSFQYSSTYLGFHKHLSRFTPKSDKLDICGLISWDCHSTKAKVKQRHHSSLMAMCSSRKSTDAYQISKKVWIWTENKAVMTASVERGWDTFIFCSERRELANDWSSIAMIHPLFIEQGEVLDGKNESVATVFRVSSSQELLQLQPENTQTENIVFDLLDWQIIPAENLVAAFQGSKKTAFAISNTPSEAQIFLEALEYGLGGIILKVEDVDAVIQLKDYFDKRNETSNLLSLTKATITRIQVAGMGDRVCVDLCSLMRPGEGLLVGSFARGQFLVHSECLESNYIASRPFRVNAGPVHAYISVPGGKTCYLSELKAGKEVIIADQKGKMRTAIVGRVKIETRPLIFVEAKIDSHDDMPYSIFLQNAETVALVPPCEGNRLQNIAIPVTSLKIGDEILLRIQGAARHTGIEIEEFIVEN